MQALAVAGLHKGTDSVIRRGEERLQVIESFGVFGQSFGQIRIGLAARPADRGRGLGDGAAQGQSGQAVEQWMVSESILSPWTVSWFSQVLTMWKDWSVLMGCVAMSGSARGCESSVR